MRRFTIIWSGQLVSMIGSAMTWFALTLWAWQETGKASALSTIAFFAFLPSVVFSPIAGALVDRWNRRHDRRLVLGLSDLVTALGTLVILLIFTLGDLHIWHIYLVSLLTGFFTAFQYPAFISAVTSLVEKSDYARAEGMLGSARALSGILAPIVAAGLLGFAGLRGIMLIDLATFLAALGTLWMVRIPPPEATQTGLRNRGTLAQEIRFGFTYIRDDRMLSSLTALFMIAGVFLAIGATLIAPLVLGGTGNSESALASVQAVGAVGGVAGGALLSLWGGFVVPAPGGLRPLEGIGGTGAAPGP